MNAEILAVVARWEQAQADMAGLCFAGLTAAEVLAIQKRLEHGYRAQPAVDHQLIHQLTAQATPAELGANSWPKVLSEALRISTDEAKRRIKQAELLGPRTAMTGEPLPPTLPNVAAAQARGQIGSEHVRTIEKFFNELPSRIDAQTRDQAEADLARIATGLGPTQFRAAADRLALLLNQDGDLPDEADRARRRYLTIDKQDAGGMSRFPGLLDPEARATLDAVLAKLAAPGMCNPDDEAPCVDGEPTDAAVQGDARSPGQRNHDALKAMGRAVLASGELGRTTACRPPSSSPPRCRTCSPAPGWRSPAAAACCRCATSSGWRQAHHYLVIYDKHTRQPLYCGRAKRSATPGQRIVLHALERGCTRPGCTAPAYWCQVHHVDDWAADNGQTNIDDLTLACGPDNRLVEDGGWTHPKTQRRPHRMATTTTPRHRTAASQRLSSSREVLG